MLVIFSLCWFPALPLLSHSSSRHTTHTFTHNSLTYTHTQSHNLAPRVCARTHTHMNCLMHTFSLSCLNTHTHIHPHICVHTLTHTFHTLYACVHTDPQSLWVPSLFLLGDQSPHQWLPCPMHLRGSRRTPTWTVLLHLPLPWRFKECHEMVPTERKSKTDLKVGPKDLCPQPRQF